LGDLLVIANKYAASGCLDVYAVRQIPNGLAISLGTEDACSEGVVLFAQTIGEVSMAKGVVNVHGEDVVVREDTAKAYRGIRWAIISILAFAAIVAVMFFAGFFASVKDGKIESPAITDRPAQ
jgi:hypothetical protein